MPLTLKIIKMSKILHCYTKLNLNFVLLKFDTSLDNVKTRQVVHSLVTIS